ncbi:MAG: hypothetical protein K6E51_06770 [Treponema sp.]|nr:hypothetical protein [Treponema sp.]
MRKSLRLCSVLFGSVLLLVSCSDLMGREDGNGTVTLSFNGASFANNSARNVTADLTDYDSYWICVSISGDYTGSKTVKVSESPSTQQVVFDDVPTGSNITINANVFSQSFSPHGYHKFTGSKSNVSVGSGQTNVSITMKSIEMDWQITQKHYSNINGGEYSLYLFENGKFVLQSNTAGTNVSEGLYEGDMNTSGTLSLKEYVFVNYSIDGDGNMTWGNVTFVESPQSTSVPYSFSGDNIAEFTFTSASGLFFKPSV